MFPALCEMSLPDLKSLVEYWPPHNKCSFNDPARAMESRAFWQGQRRMDGDARYYLMGTLLPTLVDTSDWTSQQRLEMLEPMLLRIKEHPGLVRQRLALWTAWGGDLAETVNLPAAEGDLTAPTTTGNAWLAEQGIDLNATSPAPPRKRSSRPR
jgi:hypothetical protein